ncbi:MAG: hypothetical protein AVDCRST_MAG03-696, partial [uncultured Rubrobacteraceae bacterium]
GLDHARRSGARAPADRGRPGGRRAAARGPGGAPRGGRLAAPSEGDRPPRAPARRRDPLGAQARALRRGAGSGRHGCAAGNLERAGEGRGRVRAGCRGLRRSAEAERPARRPEPRPGRPRLL